MAVTLLTGCFLRKRERLRVMRGLPISSGLTISKGFDRRSRQAGVRSLLLGFVFSLLSILCINTGLSSRNGTTRACCQYEVELKSLLRLRHFIMKPITQENDRLGFVGIGYMGMPIARRLLEAGFKLTAHDQDRNKASELVRYGGTVAESV